MGRYAEYRLPRGPLGRLRHRWWARRHPDLVRPPQPVADGRDYTGWTARVVTEQDGTRWPVTGSQGAVVGVVTHDGQLVHQIAFGDLTIHTPLPVADVELLPPAD